MRSKEKGGQGADPRLHEEGLDEYLSGLDKRVSDLDKWIERAAESLLRFSAERGGFFRNTYSTGPRDLPGSTSTARSLFALHEYRCYLQEESLDIPEPLDNVLDNTLKKWVLRLARDERLKTLAKASENGKNLFTDSHALVALSLTSSLANDLGLSDTYIRTSEGLAEVEGALLKRIDAELKERGVMALTRRDPAPHHFITLHGVRALDIAEYPVAGSDKVRHSISATVLEQLGYHSAGVMARFDPGALVFATSLLGRFKAADRQQLTEHAVRVAAEVQTDDGAWHSAQVIAAKGGSRIYVSSYEVALSLTFLALRELAFGDIELAKKILHCLDRAMELVRASYISEEARPDDFRGWANDRSRWPGLIESWATASVLSFLLRYREVVLQMRQQLVLDRYGVSLPNVEDDFVWPDLDLAFPATRDPDATASIRASASKALDEYSDPSDKKALTTALKSKFVDPVFERPGNRPDKASLILYGPAGSRKTSLVTKLAKGLGWPLVTLSPPDFLGDRGLDGFEGAAATIFQDLLRLRRVVVLFDECEDFFKPRRPEASRDAATDRPSSQRDDTQERPESRTIGAFLTAGMLPRLQRLRDNRWVLFILATNIEDLAELDEAVRRPGRFDYAEAVRHPHLAAQCQYVVEHWRAEELELEQIGALQEALKSFDRSRKENEVPFAVIDYVIATILDNKLPGTREEAESVLRRRMEDVRNPPVLRHSEFI